MSGKCKCAIVALGLFENIEGLEFAMESKQKRHKPSDIDFKAIIESGEKVIQHCGLSEISVAEHMKIIKNSYENGAIPEAVSDLRALRRILWVGLTECGK